MTIRVANDAEWVARMIATHGDAAVLNAGLQHLSTALDPQYARYASYYFNAASDIFDELGRNDRIRELLGSALVVVGEFAKGEQFAPEELVAAFRTIGMAEGVPYGGAGRMPERIAGEIDASRAAKTAGLVAKVASGWPPAEQIRDELQALGEVRRPSARARDLRS